MYGNDVRRTAIFGQYGTAVRSVHNCSENTNVNGVRPFTKWDRYVADSKELSGRGSGEWSKVHKLRGNNSNPTSKK